VSRILCQFGAAAYTKKDDTKREKGDSHRKARPWLSDGLMTSRVLWQKRGVFGRGNIRVSSEPKDKTVLYKSHRVDGRSAGKNSLAGPQMLRKFRVRGKKEGGQRRERGELTKFHGRFAVGGVGGELGGKPLLGSGVGSQDRTFLLDDYTTHFNNRGGVSLGSARMWVRLFQTEPVRRRSSHHYPICKHRGGNWARRGYRKTGEK